MSWRIITQALHALGKPATAAQVELFIGGAFSASDSLNEAAKLGLVNRPGRGSTDGGTPPTWTLTKLGIDWCEGRVEELRGPRPDDLRRWFNRGGREGRCGPRPQGPRGKGIWFSATWLASLPRDVRFNQPEMETA